MQIGNQSKLTKSRQYLLLKTVMVMILLQDVPNMNLLLKFRILQIGDIIVVNNLSSALQDALIVYLSAEIVFVNCI